MLPTLTLLAALSAVLHIRAEYRGPRWCVYIFKPLTMGFIVLIAFTGPPGSGAYRHLVIGGLLFSLAGDVFLMLPSDCFVAGLVAFLVAHLFYIAAFAPVAGALQWWPVLPLAAYGVGIYRILAPGLGKLKRPVLAYIAVIMVMAWMGWEQWFQAGRTGALMIFAGALLFVVSDTVLALNRFGRGFKAARALNLSTYFAAQWLIAGSVCMG